MSTKKRKKVETLSFGKEYLVTPSFSEPDSKICDSSSGLENHGGTSLKGGKRLHCFTAIGGFQPLLKGCISQAILGCQPILF